jgi:4-diphosphocytidyl-2-C-methyl-D-erythritol kinase
MEVYRVGSAIRIDTPAKLNLFLEVLSKRPDGFHEIETVMTAISIYDTLIVTGNTEGRIRLTCDWASGLEARRGDGIFGPLPSEANNLVYKAAGHLLHQAGISQGVAIRLVKRIPSEAGLGGASSDAAAALLALNAFWNLGWSRERLAGLAAELGSDVPFFLLRPRQGAMAAVCRGRGERITPVVGAPRLHFALVKPLQGLSTAAVYQRCKIPVSPQSTKSLVTAWRTGNLSSVGQGLFNRLQEVAEDLSGEVRVLRRTCEQLDVWGHGMSGSGTSYFVLCRSAVQAQHVAARLRAKRLGQVFHAMTL